MASISSSSSSDFNVEKARNLVNNTLDYANDYIQTCDPRSYGARNENHNQQHTSFVVSMLTQTKHYITFLQDKTFIHKYERVCDQLTLLMKNIQTAQAAQAAQVKEIHGYCQRAEILLELAGNATFTEKKDFFLGAEHLLNTAKQKIETNGVGTEYLSRIHKHLTFINRQEEQARRIDTNAYFLKRLGEAEFILQGLNNDTPLLRKCNILTATANLLIETTENVDPKSINPEYSSYYVEMVKRIENASALLNKLREEKPKMGIKKRVRFNLTNQIFMIESRAKKEPKPFVHPVLQSIQEQRDRVLKKSENPAEAHMTRMLAARKKIAQKAPKFEASLRPTETRNARPAPAPRPAVQRQRFQPSANLADTHNARMAAGRERAKEKAASKFENLLRK